RFCRWLADTGSVQAQLKDALGETKSTVRLPTEAEWEYACRAGSPYRYYFGDNEEDLPRNGNVADGTFKETFYHPKLHWALETRDWHVFTAPAGRFTPNKFGLYDMHGNAWQWCEDYYDPIYYQRGNTKDPINNSQPMSNRSRVVRGGAWDSFALY